MESTLTLRFESRGGKYWAELYSDGSYKSNDGGGYLGTNQPKAIADFMSRISNGYFQADANITPMKCTHNALDAEV